MTNLFILLNIRLNILCNNPLIFFEKIEPNPINIVRNRTHIDPEVK